MAETPAQRRHRHEQEAVALEEEIATIATHKLELDVRNAGVSIIAQYLKGKTGRSLATIIKRQFRAVKPRVRRSFTDLDLVERAVALGVHQGRELAAGVVPPTEFRDPALNEALGQLDKNARRHLDDAIVLAAALPLDDRASVMSVLAKSHQTVTKADAEARWIAERAASAGTAAAAKSVGANVMWVAERDGCLHCLAYAGQIVKPGDEFPPDLTYGDKPLKPYGKLWFPPLHPNCRCQIELTYEDVGQDDSLVREAERSVARGTALASEPAQRRAADRLLSGPNMLPKTVIKRARIKHDLGPGGEPVPAYVPRGPRKPAAPKVPAKVPFDEVARGRDLGEAITKMTFPPFPDDVRDPLIEYQSIVYEPVNEDLRSQNPRPTYPATADGLDKVFRMLPGLPVEGVVSRGMGMGHFPKGNLAGQVVRDLGFMSTTMEPKKAAEFAFSVDQAAIWEIRLPVGTKVLPLQYAIDSILNEEQGQPPTMKSLFFYEAELLLNRGTQLRIISDEMDEKNVRRIKAEVIPDE